MARQSAGILLYRRTGAEPEFLLVHPGGPFWAKRDEGVWSLPKGEYEDGDDPLESARREFEEETGTALDPAEPVELGTVKQKSGKLVIAWAAEGEASRRVASGSARARRRRVAALVCMALSD